MIEAIVIASGSGMWGAGVALHISLVRIACDSRGPNIGHSREWWMAIDGILSMDSHSLMDL